MTRAALAARCDLAEAELAALEGGEREATAGEMVKLEDALAMPRGSSFHGVRWDQRGLRFAVEPPPRAAT